MLRPFALASRFALLWLAPAALLACGDGSAASPAADAAIDVAMDAPLDVTADAPTDADAAPPFRPACATVTGTAAVTFSLDEGATLAPTATTLTSNGYTFGLVRTDRQGTLVAEHAGSVIRSTDAGCTWTEIGTVSAFPLMLVAAPGGRVYAFKDNDAPLYRIDGATITKLTSPATSVLGLGVDAKDARALRLGDSEGRLWASTDGGDTWTQRGTAVPTSTPLIYRYAFAPDDLSHAIVGLAVDGAYVTTDDGAAWAPVKGLSTGRANAFNVIYAPSDPRVVYAQGIDLAYTGGGTYDGRNVWRSTDGGATFAKIVEQSAEITLRNQELLAPHPTDPAVLYFVFGTYYAGYGTDVYRWDARTGKVTKTHDAYDDVSALAFSPDGVVMYLGATFARPH